MLFGRQGCHHGEPAECHWRHLPRMDQAREGLRASGADTEFRQTSSNTCSDRDDGVPSSRRRRGARPIRCGPADPRGRRPQNPDRCISPFGRKQRRRCCVPHPKAADPPASAVARSPCPCPNRNFCSSRSWPERRPRRRGLECPPEESTP